MPLLAIIFDFDGVIIDSETPEFHTWKQICSRYGVDIPLEVWEKGMGSSLEAFDPLVYLETSLGQPIDRVGLKAEQECMLWEHLNKQSILPGIEDYMYSAHRLGIQLAIASSSPLDWVGGHLTRLGLYDHFTVICTKDDVKQVKPDPALFLLALEKLGVEPHEAAVVEDSPNGLQAAMQAGIFRIAVPTTLSCQLDLSNANLILNSLAELPLEGLIERYFS